MNIILDLLDEEKVKRLFAEKILPQYPDYTGIKKIKIRPFKKLIWNTTYHVVLEFSVYFQTRSGQTEKLPIICTAHSSEPRENVFDALRYLWDHNFSKGMLSVPHPLFYSDYYRGTFYRAASGKTLYHYIKRGDRVEIESVIPKVAKWFAKLHNLPVDSAPNFNPENCRIESAIPGVPHILSQLKANYPEYHERYGLIYQKLIANENDFFAKTEKRWFVHGDAHPENIIRMSRRKIAVIDFADLCLSDYARDLGSFLQQLDYMCGRKIDDAAFAEKIKKSFLDNYFKHFKKGVPEDIDKRINTYYNWTAMRTATYFLTRCNPDSSRAEPLLEQVENRINSW